MELTCPKCQGRMRSYERSGITVDQCTECRGIFLDRGELEHLADAETAFRAGARTESAAVPPPTPRYGVPVSTRYPDEDDEDRYRDGRYRENRYDDHYEPARRPRKRSFLEDLFD